MKQLEAVKAVFWDTVDRLDRGIAWLTSPPEPGGAIDEVVGEKFKNQLESRLLKMERDDVKAARRLAEHELRRATVVVTDRLGRHPPQTIEIDSRMSDNYALEVLKLSRERERFGSMAQRKMVEGDLVSPLATAPAGPRKMIAADLNHHAAGGPFEIKGPVIVGQDFARGDDEQAYAVRMGRHVVVKTGPLARLDLGEVAGIRLGDDAEALAKLRKELGGHHTDYRDATEECPCCDGSGMVTPGEALAIGQILMDQSPP